MPPGSAAEQALVAADQVLLLKGERPLDKQYTRAYLAVSQVVVTGDLLGLSRSKPLFSPQQNGNPLGPCALQRRLRRELRYELRQQRIKRLLILPVRDSLLAEHAMPQRVLAAARLSLCGLVTSGPAGIPAVCFDLFLSGHEPARSRNRAARHYGPAAIHAPAVEGLRVTLGMFLYDVDKQ